MKLKLLLWKTLIAGVVALVGFTDFSVPPVANSSQEAFAAKDVVSSHTTPSKLLLANISPLPSPTPKPVVVFQKTKSEPRILASKIEAVSDCKMQWPVGVKTRTTQGFSGRHTAFDIQGVGVSDAPIIAAAAGTVIEAKHGGWNGGYGNVVVIDHGNGYLTRYGHNSKVIVEVGQEVIAGQQIAVMGKTGRVHAFKGGTGIHLHFEVLRKGRRINPGSCLK